MSKGSCANESALFRCLLIVCSKNNGAMGGIALLRRWKHLLMFFNAECNCVALRDRAWKGFEIVVVFGMCLCADCDIAFDQRFQVLSSCSSEVISDGKLALEIKVVIVLLNSSQFSIVVFL